MELFAKCQFGKKKLQTAYEAGGEAVADRGRGLIELETII
jgi:hypothetical protein